jgi:DNA mismatch endonuclease (patch repair protein)
LADVVTAEVRSRMMAGIRGVNTNPEMAIRRGLHALGWRYRLHARGLPGKPDLVFASRRAVIFVDGCFWHGHDCALFKWPSTRPEFWREKVAGNIARDLKVRRELLDRGWRVLDVHECVLKGKGRWPVDEVLAECARFLEGDEPRASIGGFQTVVTG